MKKEKGICKIHGRWENFCGTGKCPVCEYDNPKEKKEAWEESFDRITLNLPDNDYDDFGGHLKSFIHTLLAQERKKVVEETEKEFNYLISIEENFAKKNALTPIGEAYLKGMKRLMKSLRD